jgi:hypothetical protein
MAILSAGHRLPLPPTCSSSLASLSDQPPFYPIVDEADVTVQTLDHLLGAGRGNAMVGFDTTYLNRGFDLSANPSEIYLRILRPSIQLDASNSGQSVGGLAKPNARIVALSRLRGLVGGNPQSGTSTKPQRAAGLAAVAAAPAAPSPPSPSPSPNPLLNPGYGLGDTPAAAAGRFDPAEFFGGALAGAKLLGLISLKDLIKVTDFAKAPQLQEHTVRRSRSTTMVPYLRPLRQLQSSIAMARNGSILRCFLTWLFNCRKMALSLAGILRRVSNRSLTRPPAAWANSRTSSPTRCVFRADGSAIANASANVFRAHCSLRHRQRPERISSVAGTP